MKISDLHTHPSLKPYNNRTEANNTFQNIWNGVIGRDSYFYKISGLLRKEIKETVRDSQSNLNEFISGDIQTAAMVIHPIERGWFMRPRKKRRRFWKWAIRKILGKKGLPYLAATLTGIPLKRAEKYISDAEQLLPVDYYDSETYPEYEYIIDQQRFDGSWGHPYQVVKDHSSYIASRDKGEIPLFLSIEGGHSLTSIPDGSILRKEYNELNNSELDHLDKSLTSNIVRIKGGGGDKSFSENHTPIYVTLVHMFQNFLSGHSRSYMQGKMFAPGMEDLLDQVTALNTGLTDLGRKAIDLLTSTENGSRILIDVKHLSVKARNEYYQIAKQNKIPIIGSHIALAGVSKFPEYPRDPRSESDDHYFSRWSINFSDEDVRAVDESDGILGLALHEGRMPGGKALKTIKEIKKKICKGKHLEETLRREYMRLVMSNIFQIISVINHKRAWSRIMIGSDYDGIMNPFDIYPKTSYFQRFIYDLQAYLENPFDLIIYKNDKETTLKIGQIKELMFGLTPEAIADMIAIKNFENFIERHY